MLLFVQSLRAPCWAVVDSKDRFDRLVTRTLPKEVLTRLLASAKAHNMRLHAVLLSAFMFATQHALNLKQGEWTRVWLQFLFAWCTSGPRNC